MNKQRTVKDKMLVVSIYATSAYISYYFIQRGMEVALSWTV